jgi:O-antigen/teichoic acid export membrane protein
VLRIRHLLGGSQGGWFVSTRGVSAGLALALALSYTKALGVDKRSILAFVMISAILLTYFLTSGISLAIRNKPAAEVKDEELFGFLFLVILAGLLVAILNCGLLLLYSQTKSEIPAPIYIVCFLYSFFACVNMGYQDALLAKQNLKLATFFELTTVLVQVFSLIFFVTVSQTSLIVSIFIAFIFSYILISFSTGVVFLATISLDLRRLSQGMRSVLSQSRNHHLSGIANGLLDRVDRFLIGLILPISFLAKYTLIASFITFSSFIPDAAVKLNLLRHHQGKGQRNIPLNIQTLSFVIFVGVFLTLAAQFFLKLIFGQEWLLPYSVGVMLAAQEILRGIYQLNAVKLIATGGKKAMTGISMLLVVLSVLSITLGIIFLGIWGAPAAMVFVYIIAILSIKTKLKEIANVD